MSDECRSCHAPVMWLEHATTGKRAPIDRDPAPDGNIVLLAPGHYNVLARSERTDAQTEGHPLFTNHFATCADSDYWKERQHARR